MYTHGQWECTPLWLLDVQTCRQSDCCLTNTNIRSDATDEHVRYPFLLNHLLKACFAQFSVIEKCGVRVNIWDNSFTDDLSGWMNLSWDVNYSGFSVLQRYGSPSGLCGARLPRTPGHSDAAIESAPSWEVQQISPCRTHCRHQPLGSRAINDQSVTQCGGVQSLHSNYVINHRFDKNIMFPTLLSGWSFLRCTVSMKETWSCNNENVQFSLDSWVINGTIIIIVILIIVVVQSSTMMLTGE